MKEITPGLRFTVEAAVGEGDTALALGSGTLPVLATPRMAALMEEAAWRSVAPFLEEGESSVGTALHLKHVSATPRGHEAPRGKRADRGGRAKADLCRQGLRRGRPHRRSDP